MRAPLLLICGLICVTAAADNIVPNPGFEDGGTTSAAGWQTDTRAGQYEFLVDADAHSGARCVSVRSTEAGDAGWARWYNADLYLVEGATYHLSAWVKTDGGASAEVWIPSDDAGFFRSTAHGPAWQEIAGDFSVARTGRHGLYLQVKGEGAASFDDISVELVEPAPVSEADSVPTDGLPIVGIVIPDTVQPHHGYLAQECRRILAAITGKTPAVATASAVAPTDSGRYVWIGAVPPGSNFGPQLALVGEEGIVLDIGPRAIVCLGNTPRGTYYAVHELLHILGCRWPWPGPLGEVLPSTDTLALPTQLVVHEPSFALRGGHIIQVHHQPPDWKPKHINTEAWVDWAARSRMNRLKASYPTMWSYGAIRGGEWNEFAGHTLYTILPPEKWFETHPEYYPLVKGERTPLHSSGRAAEICVSNPELPQVFADHICEYFAEHPGAKRFGINAEDEPSYWCECDACKALDTEELDWTQNGIKTMHLTDRWMYFINKVAQLVEQKYPDKIIFTFAYASTRELPHKYLPRHNVMIELTWWDECFKHAMIDPDCEVNAKGMERFHDWSRLAGLSLYRYLDYHHNESPTPYYHAEADILRTVHAAGCRHLSDEWDTTFTSSPLLLNLRARLEWDVNTDVDAYIDDFCARVYGQAGSTVAKYFHRLERGVLEAPTDHVGLNNMEKFTPELLKDGHALLDEAEKLAETDDILARIDRLRYSLLFAELDQLTEKAKQDPGLYPRHAEVQQRLWDLVQTRKIEPILGYFGRLGLEYKPPVKALSGRRVVQLPENWQFSLDPEDVGEQAEWFTGDGADWETLSTLKPWEEQGHGGYDGVAWYTVETDIPEIPEPRVWLLCGAVDETFKLWINGEYVGASEGDPGLLWDKPVAVEITGKFRTGATNRITMRVHDSAYAGGIWKPVWITAGD